MGIGAALGAVLSGVGDGMEKQAVMDDANQRQQQAANLQYQRDLALENLRAQNQSAAAVQTSQLQDTRDANHQARAFAYDTGTAQQKQTYEQQNIRLKGSIDLSNDKQLEAVKQRYKLTDIQAQSMADLQKDLAVAGQTADHWGVTTDGRMVAFNKQGGVLRYSANPGSFIPSGESQNGSDTGLGIGGATGSIAGEQANRGNGGGGGNTPAPAAKPAAKPTSSNAPAKAPAADNTILGQLSRLPPPPDGQVGRTMTGPNGYKARWNGKQWVLMDVTGVPGGR